MRRRFAAFYRSYRPVLGIHRQLIGRSNQSPMPPRRYSPGDFPLGDIGENVVRKRTARIILKTLLCVDAFAASEVGGCLRLDACLRTLFRKKRENRSLFDSILYFGGKVNAI